MKTTKSFYMAHHRKTSNAFFLETGIWKSVLPGLLMLVGFERFFSSVPIQKPV